MPMTAEIYVGIKDFLTSWATVRYWRLNVVYGYEIWGFHGWSKSSGLWCSVVFWEDTQRFTALRNGVSIGTPKRWYPMEYGIL